MARLSNGRRGGGLGPPAVMRWGLGAAAGLVAVCLALPFVPRATGAAAPPTVGVVDFYAITPVESAVGVIPERFAADDLSAMLGGAAQGRFTMVPRETMQQAEASLRWREADVLHFARLSALARQAHADRLVVGWIQRYGVAPDGGDDMLPNVGGGGMATGYAALVVQDFDVSQRRIVAQASGEVYSTIGMVLPLAVEDVLHRALEPTLAPIVSALTGPGS